MSNQKTTSSSVLYLIISIATAVIGMQIHNSVFWAIVDFFFWPFAWLKWLICHEVSISIIKEAFSFFFN